MDLRKFDLKGEMKAHLYYLDQGGNHPAIEAAERAVFAATSFLDRMLQLSDEIDVEDIVAITCDNISDIVGRAVKQAENDRMGA